VQLLQAAAAAASLPCTDAAACMSTALWLSVDREELGGLEGLLVPAVSPGFAAAVVVGAGAPAGMLARLAALPADTMQNGRMCFAWHTHSWLRGAAPDWAPCQRTKALLLLVLLLLLGSLLGAGFSDDATSKGVEAASMRWDRIGQAS